MRISDWSSDVCSSDLENHYTVVDRFPFAYARSTDHLTGREDAILKRPDADPLVIHTDSASEYWHRRASLVVTDTHGRDLALPETVRVQLWASSQHSASPLVAKPARSEERRVGKEGVSTGKSRCPPEPKTKKQNK